MKWMEIKGCEVLNPGATAAHFRMRGFNHRIVRKQITAESLILKDLNMTWKKVRTLVVNKSNLGVNNLIVLLVY